MNRYLKMADVSSRLSVGTCAPAKVSGDAHLLLVLLPLPRLFPYQFWDLLFWKRKDRKESGRRSFSLCSCLQSFFHSSPLKQKQSFKEQHTKQGRSGEIRQFNSSGSRRERQGVHAQCAPWGWGFLDYDFPAIEVAILSSEVPYQPIGGDSHH